MVNFRRLREQTPEQRAAARKAIFERYKKEQDDKIKDLCAIEEGLDDWELDFVESVAKQYEDNGSLSDRQWEFVDKILKKHA